jgi:glycosyltransferase involved in cell wall biosynthesis
MMPRPRVVFWDTLPAPYGVEEYNALADRGALDFCVWYARRTAPDRRWDVDESAWRFRGAYVEDPSRGLAAAHRFVSRCRAELPQLIVSPYGERAFVAGHALAKALGSRTAFVVQASFDAWVRRSWPKETAKAVLFRSVDAAHAGPGGVGYARRYGVPDHRIFVVKPTTNIELFARRVTAEQRHAHRVRIGVSGCVFLYVGRLWKPKGLLDLIEAFRRARRIEPAMSLLLIGDGEDECEIRDAARGIEGVVFWPFVQRPALPDYYAAADVFVFPTLGDPHGRVIEEAHAAGLPVITSAAAGDARRRVQDGNSGFVVAPGDPAALADRMLTLAADPGLRRSMGERGAERVRTWGHDAYVTAIEDLVRACLAQTARATMAARLVTAAGRVAVHASDAARVFHREFA